jgi:hypothetical protein
MKPDFTGFICSHYQVYILICYWLYCHDLGVYDYRRCMDLLIIHKHHSEQRVFTALSVIHTLQITITHAKPFSSLLYLHQSFHSFGFWQWRFFSFTRSGPLVTAAPAELLSDVNSPIASSLFGLPCRAQLAGCQVRVKVKVTLRLTVSQSVCLGVEPRLGLMTRYYFLNESYCPVQVGRPLWREVGFVICQS